MHEYVLLQLTRHRGDWQRVADGAGVPLRTLEKIARIETKDPYVSNVQKLYDWFRVQPDVPPLVAPPAPRVEPVKES